MAQQILSTNTFTTAKWIVSATSSDGTHTTIGAALTSASSGDTIFIRPGTYTENLTLKVGVDLVSYSGEGLTPNVTIIGNCTLSTAGKVTITGIQLQTNSAACLTVSGSAVSVVNLVGCYINAANNNAISYTSSNASSSITLYQCNGTLAASQTLYSMSSAGVLLLYNCNISSSSTVASSNSAGSVNWIFCFTNVVLSVSSTGNLDLYGCTMNTGNTTCVAFAGSGINGVNQCDLISGSASAITIAAACSAGVYNSQIASTNTNCITGSGAINYSGLNFSSSSIGSTTALINVTSQVGGTLVGGKFQAPSAGFLGEQIRSFVNFGSAVNVNSATTVNITNISLTAGVWDVSLNAQIQAATTTNATQVSAGITTTSATLGTNFGDNQGQAFPPTTTFNAVTISIPSYRITVSSTTTVYYVASSSTYSAGQISAYGRLSATRVG